jgi:hypothetical protein
MDMYRRMFDDLKPEGDFHNHWYNSLYRKAKQLLNILLLMITASFATKYLPYLPSEKN